MNARLIVCENCGKALAKHCRKHWVSGPHCPGHCKTGEQSWSQPDGGGAGVHSADPTQVTPEMMRDAGRGATAGGGAK